MADKKPGWKTIPHGGLIVEPGNSVKYKTGDWRTFRPIHDMSRCTHCMICWMYCPDSSIKVKNGKFIEFDYDYCKGCGICSSQCPVKCIEMKSEEEFR